VATLSLSGSEQQPIVRAAAILLSAWPPHQGECQEGKECRGRRAPPSLDIWPIDGRRGAPCAPPSLAIVA
jgi:hypothetical protein